MGQRLVKDFMVTAVVTLFPEDRIERAVATLLEHQVGGAPVVDAQGRLVGLLSDRDLLVRQGRIHVPTIFTIFSEHGRGFPPPSLEAFVTALHKALGTTVGEVMDPNPPTCTEEETAEDVATRMLDHDASRLPVVRDGILVGIVARGDLLRLLGAG